ncbi:MAG: hypothetical protein IKQ16_09230, partial [Lentisphaeria bacterium]|nr:hypothetical protein [Lentisphaeria bacterium]
MAIIPEIRHSALEFAVRQAPGRKSAVEQEERDGGESAGEVFFYFHAGREKRIPAISGTMTPNPIIRMESDSKEQ